MLDKAVAFVVAAVGVSVLSAQTPPAADLARDARSTDPHVRLGALAAARELPPLDVPNAIALLLADPVDRVQLEALDVLLAAYLAREVPMRRRVALVVEVRGQSRAETAFDSGPLAIVPRPVPPDVTTGLLAAMQDDTRAVRVEATYLAGAILHPPADKQVADHLIESLGQPEPLVRRAAALALGRLRVAAAGEALVNAINDPVDEVRLAAMRALGDLRDARAVQALEEQLAYFDRGPQAEAALAALARVGHAGSLKTFTARLKDRDPELRRYAAEGLGRAGDKTATASLELTIGAERDQRVALAMAFALQRLGRPYVDRLVNALTRADRRTADQIAAYLIELGPTVAASVVSYLQGPEPRIRALVAETMGMIGSPQIASALEALRRDPSPDVAAAAERALERLTYRRAS